MFGVPAAERVFWRSDSCTVWVSYGDAGALVFNGDDRQYLDGYAYYITVAPDQFDKLRARSLPTGRSTWLTWCAPTATRSWPAASGAGSTTTG
jgi:hypothetical protein